MRKQFTILLILTFVLGLVPINFSEAITQNQISAEVQIVCPDSYGNWYSGSGTIIDPKGIILTNKHVVSDQYGGIIKTCFIGFTESINQEPSFGTQANPNLAEVKYYTTASDMDAAILYLNNPTNKSYTHVDIWNSNSNTLQFGHKIEAIGFPSIGGSTITYTSGDFSGFGSASDGTQNYIKATTPLEHGNSGGAAYNPAGQFIGIPTMVVAGTLNSLSYILSVNSVKNWLSGILGNNYQQEVIKQTPAPTKPTVTIQNDITPPNFNNLDNFCYRFFEGNTELGTNCYPPKRGKVEEWNQINFYISKDNLYSIDSSGLSKVYYYFDTKPHIQIDNNAIEFVPEYYNQNDIHITDRINISRPGKYFFTFFGVDGAGNISNPYIYEYVYEPQTFKSIKNIYFYKDSALKYYVKGYDVNVNEKNYLPNIPLWQQGTPTYAPLQCKTRLNNLTIAWEYPETYSNYIAKHYNSWDPLVVITVEGGVINENKYTINNLQNGNKITWHEGIDIGSKSRLNIYYEFYLKPYIAGKEIEKKHKIIKISYDPSLSSDLLCDNLTYDGYKVYTETNKKPSSIIIEKEKIEFANRLKGKILLQVEARGEAYYVYPDDLKRYYLGRPSDAFDVMRNLGLGISEANYNKFNGYATSNLAGKILLRVEANGEAYYINPADRKMHYLGRPADAFRIMRELGLGITNSDLNKIAEGNL